MWKLGVAVCDSVHAVSLLSFAEIRGDHRDSRVSARHECLVLSREQCCCSDFFIAFALTVAAVKTNPI